MGFIIHYSLICSVPCFILTADVIKSNRPKRMILHSESVGMVDIAVVFTSEEGSVQSLMSGQESGLTKAIPLTLISTFVDAFLKNGNFRVPFLSV